jgi:(4-O-methyl)-D-glucuronate---lignin esterase
VDSDERFIRSQSVNPVSSSISYAPSRGACAEAFALPEYTHILRFFMPQQRLLTHSFCSSFVAAFFLCITLLPFTAQAKGAQPERRESVSSHQIAQAAEEKDRQYMLDMLGIKELRPPASYSHADSPYAANYDEAKANVYSSVPDPLALNDGKPVTTPKVWWKQRRPQIVAAFNRDVFGKVPAHMPRVAWKVLDATDESIGNVSVISTKIDGRVDNSIDPKIDVNIHMVLVLPAHTSGPVPLILELPFDDEFVPIWAGSLPVARPGDPEPPWQVQVLRQGWGYAMLSPTSFQADNGAGLDEGIIGLMDKGHPRTPSEWGAIRAWAWGASQALDYLGTVKSVDSRQVGIAGHSRFGKTALVAMAYDPRFAVAYVNSSGEGGASLYRHIYGEQISNLTGVNEYHWFDGNFLRYGGPLNAGDLPVDSNELIALCAPRPVFIGAGNPTREGDGWADPKGMFLAEAGASPVYELLGKKDLGTTVWPPIGTLLDSGDLAYREHPGGHTPAPDWPYFIEFASRYLHAPAAK